MILEYHLSQQISMPFELGDEFSEGELAELFYALDMRTNHILLELKKTDQCKSFLLAELKNLTENLISRGVYLPICDEESFRTRDQVTKRFTSFVTAAMSVLNSRWHSITSIDYYGYDIPIRQLVLAMSTTPYALPAETFADDQDFWQTANQRFRAMVHAIGYVVSWHTFIHSPTENSYNYDDSHTIPEPPHCNHENMSQSVE